MHRPRCARRLAISREMVRPDPPLPLRHLEVGPLLSTPSFSNYGGVCVSAEYSHEVALRLVLNSLASAAARYGRYITPLLSFSIDFYVRLFVRVNTQADKVKQVAR
jgi:tRNA G26 N,N-dimethylase Trm1